MEEWKGLLYQGEDLSFYYEISNTGKLRNARNKRELKLHKNHKGYLHTVVTLGSRKKMKAILIHRAVAENFIANPNNYAEVNHKTGNKEINDSNNLEWCTGKYNKKHAVVYKLTNAGEKNGMSKLTNDEANKIREIRQNGLSYRKIAKMFDVSHVTIISIVKNKSYSIGI